MIKEKFAGNLNW